MSGNQIDKRDFDARQPLLERHRQHGDAVSQTSRLSVSDVDYDTISDDRRNDGLLYEVVEGIVERDRRRMRGEVIRVISFVWGVITWYGFRSILGVGVFLITIRALRPLLITNSISQSGCWKYHRLLPLRPSFPHASALFTKSGQWRGRRG
jgi:hypothetical protein